MLLSLLLVRGSKSSATTTEQLTLDNMTKNFKQIKLDDKEITTFKTLLCKWVCEDVRFFTAVENDGWREVFQALISLDKFVQLLCIIIFLYFYRDKNMEMLMLQMMLTVLIQYQGIFIL